MLPSISVQKSRISAALNSSLFSNLLMGAYTVVYFGTLYIYASKKSSKNRLIIGSISLSYLAYVVQNSFQWHLKEVDFLDNGESRESIYLAISDHDNWDPYLNDVYGFLLGAIADGLLVWRCFNVWGRSFRAILLPSFLLLCEIGIDLSIIILEPALHFRYSHTQALTLNAVIGASFFMTFATTLATTVLIAYRIYSLSEHNSQKRSRLHISRILEILVQSAAAYSAIAFANAVAMVVPYKNLEIQQVVTTYIASLYYFIAGAAPTIMVARVSLAPDSSTDLSTVIHISGLQFNSTAPSATQSGRISIFSDPDEDLNLPQDLKKLEVKQEAVLDIV